MTEAETAPQSATDGKYDPSENLHWPARADHLESFEEHIRKSARLARALWKALESDDGSGDDRNRDALYELASHVADHASAVEYIFHAKAEARQ